MPSIINSNFEPSVFVPTVGNALSPAKDQPSNAVAQAQAQRVKNHVSKPAVENATWYIDWTSWDYPIPEGVNTVNIFVGQFTNVDGELTMNGFGNLTATKLQAFVSQCQEKGITVNLPVGGGGGSLNSG